MEDIVNQRNRHSSHHLFHLPIVPFISPCSSSISTISQPERSSENLLSGDEVSCFYNKIISTPSSSVSKVCEKNNRDISLLKEEKITQQKQLISSNKILFYAQEGDLKALKECLLHGCKVDQQDAFGWTPIMCAVMEGHRHVVEHLIKLGADTSLKNKQNMTVLNIAEERKDIEIINLLKSGIEVNNKTAVITPACRETTLKHCSDCNLCFSESVTSHERSIAHLFNCKKTKLSTYYHIPENNKGFQIMLKNGWDKDKGLGVNSDGRKFPIKTVFKKDRACIGSVKEIAKVTHFGPNDNNSIKNQVKPLRILRERTLKKRERHKLEIKQRQKEINFRRQFKYD